MRGELRARRLAAAAGRRLRVTIGTQEFPEARVLGELWRQALAVNGYAVNLRKGVGPAEDLDQALRDGDIDGYVAYTGTVLSIVAGAGGLRARPRPRPTTQVEDYYADQDMVISEPTPFENKDAIAVTDAYAEENDLTSIADLADLDSFVLGARPEFEDLQLGLTGLQDVYDLDNAEFEPVELGQQYALLDDGERRRGRRLHHRPAARRRQLHAARRPRAALRLAERRDGRRRGQAGLDRLRGVHERHRHRQLRAHRGRDGAT